MRVGRKPKPTKLRIVEGNPGHRPLPASEPMPEGPPVRCPSWLSPEAKREWRRVAPELIQLGILTMVDRAVMVGYCVSWARLREAEEWVLKNGTTIVLRDKDGRAKSVQRAPQVQIGLNAEKEMRAFAGELGMTPSSRTRLHVEQRPQIDEFEEFLERGRN